MNLTGHLLKSDGLIQMVSNRILRQSFDLCVRQAGGAKAVQHIVEEPAA